LLKKTLLRAGTVHLLKEVAKHLAPRWIRGFYTEEVLDDAGERTGFRIVTWKGSSELLAVRRPKLPNRRDLPGTLRVGDYVVNEHGLEKIAIPELALARYSDIVLFDEMGPMQLYSRRFCVSLMNVMGKPMLCLATIVEREFPIADNIKERSDVELFQVTEENRGSAAGLILQRLAEISATL